MSQNKSSVRFFRKYTLKFGENSLGRIYNSNLVIFSGIIHVQVACALFRMAYARCLLLGVGCDRHPSSSTRIAVCVGLSYKLLRYVYAIDENIYLFDTEPVAYL